MRAALLVVLLALSAGWKDRCIPAFSGSDPCINVTATDAAAIQHAILAYVDAKGRADYRPAKKLAQPITDTSIGQFSIYGGTYADLKGDIVEAVAVEKTESGTQTGFKVTLRREKTGWRILYFDHYHQQLPRPNG